MPSAPADYEVALVATANVAIGTIPLPTCDYKQPQAGMYVLLTCQTNQNQNGIYFCDGDAGLVPVLTVANGLNANLRVFVASSAFNGAGGQSFNNTWWIPNAALNNFIQT